MLNLSSDITTISRVGVATAKKLKRLGLETVHDLLFYFPFRYDDFSHVVPIVELKAGQSANVVGQIEFIQNKRSWRRRMYLTEALIYDGRENLKIIWFNQPFITRNLKVGDRVSLAGKIENDQGTLVMKSPVYEKVNLPPPPYKGGNLVHTQGLVPNYHLTANITHKQVRFLIKQIVNLSRQITDYLPFEVKKTAKLVNLDEAIRKIHFPKTWPEIDQARKRLAFDELFLIQLRSQLLKKELKSSRAQSIIFKVAETKEFVDSLPFKLTNSQRQAAWQILQDIAKDKPMSRLLEGDVGSGKTLVALIAMLNVALNEKQAVIMVPTEILAKQHFATITKFLGNFKIKIGLISRTEKKTNFNRGIMEHLKNKKLNAWSITQNCDLIIGTHALIQEDIKFKNLTLAVIDEQHRFGVEQRKKLVAKSEGKMIPHLLSMTATPIPRSLALALYGDLDLSIINEMPKDRKKIITSVVPEEKRQKAYEFIHQQIKDGRQVFVICPLIDPSDKLGVKSVQEEYKKLDKLVFPELLIGMLHGRTKPKEKEKIMQEFLENKIKILVSTSVVEVGVDVPNASIMMIEGADRFGLAQLHQFRGRVGRSNWQSYCFLFTDSQAERSLKRLEALTRIDNGFDLAKVDLKYRGPGEIYGLEQKGFPELKIASLFDYQLMKSANEQAVKLIDKDNSLNGWPKLKEKLGAREKQVHLE